MTDSQHIPVLLSPRAKQLTTEVNKVLGKLNLKFGFDLPPTGTRLRTPAKANDSSKEKCSELIWTLGSISLGILNEVVSEFTTDMSQNHVPKQKSGPLGVLQERLQDNINLHTQGRTLFPKNPPAKTKKTPRKQPSLPSIANYLVQQPKRRSGAFDQDDKIDFNENTDPRKRSCTSSAETVELTSCGSSIGVQKSFLTATAATSFESEPPQATQYSWVDETSSQRAMKESFGAENDSSESLLVPKPVIQASTTEKKVDYRLRDLHINPLSDFKLPAFLSDVPIGFRWAIFTAVTQSKLDIE